MEAPDLETLGRQFVQSAGQVLPGDCMVWNVWTTTMDSMIGFEANHIEYRNELERLTPDLNATIHHHPVIAAGRFESSLVRPQRISDYQSAREFRRNPLFQEVYRHVDSNYQIAHTAAKLGHAQIILSWNRRSRDFKDREIQLMHLLGLHIHALSRRIDERQQLHAAWERLVSRLTEVSDIVGSDVDLALGAKDGMILAKIVEGRSRGEIASSLGWRRDTLDRHIAGIRARLGLENQSQFFRALSMLRA